MITYIDHAQHSVVKLDGKVVGHILCSFGEWFYSPKGVGKKFNGEKMPSRAAVKRSLESDES